MFCDEYLNHFNATRSYKAAYPGVKKDEVAAAAAARLLKNVKVADYIQKRMKDRQERTEITQDMVLQRWWDIATADPNEIICLRRVCCRHCWGADHQYQWLDRQEYQNAVQIARKDAKEDETPAIPSDAGGYGFNRLAKPHPDCPYCRGEGHPEIFAADTKALNPKAKLLYAGLKPTAAGIEIKLKDQDKALENVARHLGMFVDRHEHTGKDGGPIQAEMVELTPEERQERIRELLEKQKGGA